MEHLIATTEPTPEQREACAALRNKMLAFMSANKIIGSFVAVDLAGQFTTAGLNLAAEGTLFVPDGPNALTLDPEVRRLIDHMQRNPTDMEPSTLRAIVEMATKTTLSLHGVRELREAVVHQLDSILECEMRIKQMVDALPASITNAINEVLGETK